MGTSKKQEVSMTLLFTVALIAAVLFLVSCNGDSTVSEEVDGTDGNQDSPEGITESFFTYVEDGDCAQAVKLLTFDGLITGDSQIEVFIRDSASDSDISELEAEIISMTEVEAVDLISKEEALESMRERLGEDADILDTMAGNSLPRSLVVMVRDPGEVESVARRLYDNPIVDSTPGSYPPDGINYEAAAALRAEEQALESCELVVESYDYLLEEFELVDSIEETDNATIEFTAAVLLDGTEGADKDHTFILVRQGEEWKIDYVSTLEKMTPNGGIYSLMLLYQGALAPAIEELMMNSITEEFHRS